jgi:phosphatidylserine/phosphatidylglycerophosphate/cardiolipin synthase-like enzyme
MTAFTYKSAMKPITLAFVILLACSIALADPIPTGASYEVGFSPDQGSLALVLGAIGSARSSIDVAAYSFTSKPIASALLSAYQRGVKVAVVADEKANGRKYSAVQFLANAGVPVRLDDHYKIMHDKFMVIDGATVETGSFNYTQAAVKSNAENVLVLRGVKPLASRYAMEWQRLWGESTPVNAAY